MTTAGLLPAPVSLNVDKELLSYIDTNFKRLDMYLGSGVIISSGSSGVQMSPGVELYHPSSTPYIDFHRATDPAGDSNADYNVRLINSGDSILDIISPDTSHLRIAAGYMELTSAGTVRHQWWQGGEYNCTAIGVGGDNAYNVGITSSNGLIRSNLAWMGNHPIHGGYAWFGHSSMAGSSQYGFLQSTGQTLVNGPTVRIREDGADRFYVDGGECHTNVRLNVSGGLKIWSDWLRFQGQQDIYWEAYGGNIWMQDSSFIRINKAFYVANNEIRSDKQIVCGSTNGGLGVQLKQGGDNTHRIYHWGTIDGVAVDSWTMVQIRSIQYDVMEEAGRGLSTVRTVNNASSVWRDHEANFHHNRSDPRLKSHIRTMPKQKKAKLKSIKPIVFKDPTGVDTERDFFGFDATELPAEVTKKSFLVNEESGEHEECLMVDPAGILAMLWETVQELADEVDELKNERV